MITFLNEHDLISLIKNNTCFIGEGSCIDLIWSNQKFSFKNSTSVETGLSDHHHLSYSMLKTTFYQEEPKALIYCDYKTFSLEIFSSELFLKLGSQENNDYQTLEKNFVDILKRITKLQKTQKSFEVTRSFNKTLRNATMKRSKLKNEINKTKSVVDLIKHNKQQNLVVKLKRILKKSSLIT